ncbi:adenylyl-sulfate kinase [Solidesulfovibrio carbinolicus]|uniref:adenylyl-sulfate kinase n=1 Tax=Solidesulfovibrio carbinolicus TaxID=296842 RepID=A0A4P6HPI3_9BACT|nr:adenylyl-sulfate kinase [Solidesulfovibrio carbinolicus]QAZ69211.1 adenylyl-sulfate kinase [Solidesulfovibrio carbinolicus]
MQRHAQNLLVHHRRAEELRHESAGFSSHALRQDQLLSLELLLTGALYPLTGYLGREAVQSVLETLRLPTGELVPMPASLDIPAELGRSLSPGDKLALRDPEGFMLAVLTVADAWPDDPARHALALFGAATLAEHPAAAQYAATLHPWRVAGEVEGVALPQHPDFTDLRLSPAALLEGFARRGWRAVLACQFAGILTEPDRAAFEAAAATAGTRLLLLHTVGDAMAGGMAHFAAVRCARLAAAAFPKNAAQLALLPMPILAAGPRQALYEALVQVNLGATHVLARPGYADPFPQNGSRFYPEQAVPELLRAHAAEAGYTVLEAPAMAYAPSQGRFLPAASLASGEAAPALDQEDIRRRLAFDQDIPASFLLPDVAAELRRAFPPRSRQGLALFMTGLSGAGKSTLAKLLYVALMELASRPVSLLDGDIVRRHLSSELTFSKQHRNLNISRIGFVASEIAKNGGIAICAPIAPYAAGRQAARDLVAPHGGFIEIHVATPLFVCEQRDRKGLYAKARAGLVTGVTGLDDPYEIPENPEIRLDTTDIDPSEAAQEVLLYLEREGYLG